MPISAQNKGRYPKDWKAISKHIRTRSGGQCECEGECGLHRTNPGPRRCGEMHGQPAKWAKGTVVLTVAHLDHGLVDHRDTNLKAMCQRCHLRFDQPQHQVNARKTRRTKKAAGELF